MKRRFVIGLGVGVLVVAGAAGAVTPYVIGQHVENEFRDQVAAFGQGTDMPIRVTAYHRHWFSADATTQSTIDQRTITLHYKIHHGPFPGFNLATIKGRWTPENLMLSPRPTQPLLVLESRIGLDGQATTLISSPVVDGDLTLSQGEHVHVSWQGMSGTLVSDSKQHLQLKAPGLRLGSHGTTSGFDDMRLTAEAPLASAQSGQTLPTGMLGKSKIQLGRVFMRDPARDIDIACKGSLTTLARLSGNNHWRFESAANVQNLVLPSHSPSTSNLRVDDLIVKAGIDGVNADKLADLIAAVAPYRKALVTAEPGDIERIRNRIDGIIVNRLPSLLTDDTAIHFAVPTMRTSQGSAGLSLKAFLQSASDQRGGLPAQSLPALIQRVAIRASTQVDKPLLQWWINQSGQPAELQRGLAGLAQQHLITLNDKGLQSSFSMSSDSMRINGREVPDGMRKALIMSALLGMGR